MDGAHSHRRVTKRVMARGLRYWHDLKSLYPLRYVASFVAPIKHSKPIFIIGCPRSGTTLLFQIFMRSPALASLGREGHSIWENFHPLSSRQWASHALDAADIAEGERAYIYRRFYRVSGRQRFVEKTPRNCLRLGYLQALFPDAFFVFLKRDGRDTVNSLLREWRGHDHRPFHVPRQLRIQGYTGTGWKFVLPPGWEAYTSASLAEVCAFQWLACNEAVLRGRAGVPEAQWVELFYEDLVRTPVEIVRGLFERVELPFPSPVERYCRTKVNTRVGQWKKEHSEEIQSIVPRIAPMMNTLGYQFE